MASWPEHKTKNPKSFYSYILFWQCQTNLKFEDLFGETQKKTPKSFYSFLGMPNKPKVLGRPKRKTTKFFYSPKTSFGGNQKEHHKVLLFFGGRMPSPYSFLGGYPQKEHTNLKATKLVMIIMFCTIYIIYIYMFSTLHSKEKKRPWQGTTVKICGFCCIRPKVCHLHWQLSQWQYFEKSLE